MRIFAGICVLLLFAVTLTVPGETPARYPVVAYFKSAQPGFAKDARALQNAIHVLDAKDKTSVERAKQALRNCRISYKRISFFVEYFFQSEAFVFNSPAKYEVEEPYIEYEEPVGLQQIEALLYDENVYGNKEALEQQATVLTQSAEGLPTLLYNFQPTDGQILESIRQELVRIMTLYVTGYDAPLLQSGIPEAAAAMESLRAVVTPMERDTLRVTFDRAIAFLHRNEDYNTFDRLTFITDYILPLQHLLRGRISRALNANADDLFSPNAFHKTVFTQGDTTLDGQGDRIRGQRAPIGIGHDTALGRKLFFEPALSGSGVRSCATCHQPGKAFTDGLPQNASLEGGTLPRNTPTLLYAVYQYAQFWDGRAKTLEEQIDTVLHSKQEMGSTDEIMTTRTHMPKAKIIQALAAYIRTLTPYNSPFDHYMAGDQSAMTQQQQRGFNLFMGKARCGSCHFAPVFNGLIPPLYDRTEFEILGVPATADLKHPLADKDKGRSLVRPVTYYEGAFKTPTVRNAAQTAPYMHHGNFSTMQQVIDFYNQGGVTPVPNQTLSTDTLGLDKGEQAAIISFIEALNDQP